MDRLGEAMSAYINTWTHCGKRLTAINGKIDCECGVSFDWVATLGETMELLEILESVHLRTAPVVDNSTQEVGLF